MSLPWIVQGDITSHGGTVIEGDPTFATNGKPVAHVGHMVTCPKCKGGPFPIVTGAPDFINNGKPVARHGDQTACGAILISGQAVSTWGSGTPSPLTSSTRQASALSKLPSASDSHDEQFLLLDGNGRPLVSTYYTAKLASGELVHGKTDDEGKTQRFYTTGEQHIEIHLGHLDN